MAFLICYGDSTDSVYLMGEKSGYLCPGQHFQNPCLSKIAKVE
jgi:hypothetical protein